ncbi:MAG TPA: hypothetical protein VGD31_03485, partial [Sphingobacteriaceae bacterium]
MKFYITVALFLVSAYVFGQSSEELSIFDGRHWGVVLQHPETKNVTVRKNIPYFSDSKGTLKFDLYVPPSIKANEERPAIVFLNAIGERPGEMPVKDWGIYASWPKLMAAEGFIGISMEADGSRIQQSIGSLFSYLHTNGAQHHIDAQRIGVYAASANVSQSSVYLMGPNAYKGIKAAVLYYGNAAQGPYRKDLPVFFVISEGDVGRSNYTGLWNEVLKNNAPWTIAMGSGLIHAFDAFNDSDDSRRMIKQTISFWKNHLGEIPAHAWEGSIGRKVLEAEYGHNDEMALALLTDYLKSNPNEIEAVFRHSSILRNMKRYEEALAGYKKILAHDANHTQALVSSYLSEVGLGHDQEAQQYFSRAERTGKISRDQYYGIGMTLYRNNHHKEGVKFFEKLTQMNPYATDYYNLACGYAMI